MKTEINKKFEKLGFIKESESKSHGAIYKRCDSVCKYEHSVGILDGMHGEPRILSCESEFNTDGFYNAVSLTVSEIALCMEKMKEMWGEE